jgi:peptide/nickel transport system substrate-binding protein
VTAEAIVNQFEQAREAVRVLQEGFTVEQVDELTATFTFQPPFGSFPAPLASQWGWIASPTAAREMGEDFPNHPVGSGPYEFKEWVRDDHITLVRNEEYWRDDVAFFDEIEYRPIVDDGARRAALLAGDVDAIVVGQADVGALRDQDGIDVYETYAGVGGIGFNMTKPPLDDLRVRQALAHAIDVQAIIDSVLDGAGQPATGPFPHDNPFYAKADQPTYDPDQARALIEEYEADTGQEVSFEYLYTTDPVDQELAQLLPSYWQDVGATVTLGAPLTSGDHFTRRIEHQYDVSSAGMPPVIDPDVWSDLFRSTSFHNYAGHTDAELDRAADDGRARLDQAGRVEACARLQARNAELLPTFYTVEGILAVAAQPEIRGFDRWTVPDGSPGLSKQFWVPFTFDALWRDPSCR